MKVLHLIGGGDVGGAKSHVLSLVKELGKNIDVKIISFRTGVFSKDAKDMGINIEIIKSGNILSDIKQVLNVIKKENYDLIHSHGAKANMVAVVVKKVLRIPTVTTVHSDYKLDYLNSRLKKYTFGVINNLALRLIDNHIGVSKTFKKMLIQRNFDPENIYTVYNGIDFKQQFKPIPRVKYLKELGIEYDKNIVYIGILARFHPVKGLDILLKAVKVIIKDTKNVKFIIGGEGEERRNIEKLAKTLGISEYIYMPGFVNYVDFLEAIDINLLTSWSESFPYVILEGSLFKIPIISSDVGGIADLVTHGVNGYLFKPGDYMKLAENIISLVEDSNKRILFGQRLFEKASKEFSIENMSQNQYKIYVEVLNKSKYFKENFGKSKRNFDVIISGYYGFNNFGDDAMLLSIIDGLKQKNKYIRILVLSHRPIDTRLNYEINSIHRMNMSKMVKYMRKSKLFINGGGNLIQDNTSTRSLIYYLTTILLAKLFKMKVMIYGNGIGPLNRGINKYFSSKILNLVEVITLREKFSLSTLKEIKVNKPKIEISSDPAFLMNLKTSKAKIREFENIDSEDKLVGFCIRNWLNNEKYIIEIAKAADYVYEKYNLVPIFIPMHYPNDSQMGERISRRMKNKSYVLKNKYNIYQIIDFISQTELLVGMRLHALILAVKLNIPVVGLAYEPKVSAFFEEIESDNILNIDTLKADELIQQIKYVIENTDKLKNNLRGKADEMIKKGRVSQELAIELLSN